MSNCNSGKFKARFRLVVAATALVASATLLAQSTDRPFWRTVVMGTHGMVAAEHPLEALAALETLQSGGNAIDAAVAAFYVTTVVEHHQAGIGGDAFIVAYLADLDEVIFINGTGPAPRLAKLETYHEIGEIPDAGPLASDVPGAVAGFDVALERYGTKSYAELLRPAIDAAANGHPLSFWAAGNHQRTFDKVSKYPSSVKALLKDGRPYKPGDLFAQPDLALTLEMIARDGADAFYEGAIARRIDAFYKQQGGLIRYEDLADFEAEEAAPIKTMYRGLEVYEAAPNSQGIVMLMALNILEGFDLAAMGHNSADYVHVVTEALKLAFADRDYYIGDPRYVEYMPIDDLLSQSYGDARRELIQMDRAIDGVAPPGDPRHGKAVLEGFGVTWYEGQSLASNATPMESEASEDGETSSFSIADRYGNLVSVTHSINGGFGSGMVVDGLGFVLNNRMQYFSLDDDNVNVLVPGKRTRHTINPALATKDGKPFLAWNTPGGDNQPQAMLQAFLAVVDFGMNVQQAVEAATITTSSFHASNYPQSAGDTLAMPKVLADRVGDTLRGRGHKLQVGEMQQPYRQTPSGAGAVKMVMIDPETGVMFGGASPAKDDYVIGW
jgi:gamma-glutamyltranspeptidase/glutathione hydrolase